MSILEVRTALLNQLENYVDTSGIRMDDTFQSFIEEEEPKPVELDAIVIRKTGSDEEQQEFPVIVRTAVTYTLDVICYMKRATRLDGDGAQVLADRLIREALKSDVSLGCVVSWCRPTETVWGVDAVNLDIYFTVVTVECYENAIPTAR